MQKLMSYLPKSSTGLFSPMRAKLFLILILGLLELIKGLLSQLIGMHRYDIPVKETSERLVE